MNRTELEVLVIFKFSPKLNTLTLAGILKIDQFFKLVFIHCKSVKVNQNDQTQL